MNEEILSANNTGLNQNNVLENKAKNISLSENKFNLMQEGKNSCDLDLHQYKCMRCIFTTNNECSFIQHVENKHNIDTTELFFCQSCSFWSNMEYLLLEHINKNHSKVFNNNNNVINYNNLSENICNTDVKMTISNHNLDEFCNNKKTATMPTSLDSRKVCFSKFEYLIQMNCS